MTAYRVDRYRLESLSTEEILRLLKEEKEDYTPEAIEILEEILEERGARRAASEAVSDRLGSASSESGNLSRADLLIRTPGDAVPVLNGLLKKVLDGTVDPNVAHVASNIVMAILRAMEQVYMTDSGGES